MKKQFKLVHGNCLEVMKRIPDNSIDLILCDLPYAVTGCKWDTLIPFDELWAQYSRIIKNHSAIVLFAAQPFTTSLIASNLSMFKYALVWEKNRPSGVAMAKNKPMAIHEDVTVFSKGVVIHEGQSKKRMPYYPQGLKRIDKVCKNHRHTHVKAGGVSQRPSHKKEYVQEFTNYPKTILKFDCVSKPVHPTQKPTEMLEYLIKTYTKEGALVLDNTMGSGSTGVAALNTGRRFIGIEQDDNYYNIAINRMESNPKRLF